MSTGPANIPRRKQYGRLHPSGLNRLQRRTQAARERGAAVREWKNTAQEQAKLARELRAERVRRQQDVAHTRAVARREAVRAEPRPLSRAKARLREMIERRKETKQRRAAAYARRYRT
jgi:hypothetical protein